MKADTSSSREILVLTTERGLFLAYYGVCEYGTKLNLARNSVDRTSMAAHTEKPESLLKGRLTTGMGNFIFIFPLICTLLLHVHCIAIYPIRSIDHAVGFEFLFPSSIEF